MTFQCHHERPRPLSSALSRPRLFNPKHRIGRVLDPTATLTHVTSVKLSVYILLVWAREPLSIYSCIPAYIDVRFRFTGHRQICVHYLWEYHSLV